MDTTRLHIAVNLADGRTLTFVTEGPGRTEVSLEAAARDGIFLWAGDPPGVGLERSLEHTFEFIPPSQVLGAHVRPAADDEVAPDLFRCLRFSWAGRTLLETPLHERRVA